MEVMSYHSFEMCSVLSDFKPSHFQALRSFSVYFCCFQSVFFLHIFPIHSNTEIFSGTNSPVLYQLLFCSVF
jgi:hypothetical protein